MPRKPSHLGSYCHLALRELVDELRLHGREGQFLRGRNLGGHLARLTLNEMRRVVITGMGAVTPLGNDLRTTWARLLAGESGVDRIKAFDPSPFPVQIAAEVKDDYDPSGAAAPKELRKLDRNVLFALAPRRRRSRTPT